MADQHPEPQRRRVLHTSIILVGTRHRTRVYPSEGDMPVALRRQLRASTRGENSATMVIADRHGRQQLQQALSLLGNRQPGSISALLAGKSAQPPKPRVRPRRRAKLALPTWSLALSALIMLLWALWLMAVRYVQHPS